MTYTEWCKQVAQLVRDNGLVVVTEDSVARGPVNYLDEPLANWFNDVTPQQAANEIIRRVKTLRRA
jgi:hypothetical protein